MNNHYERKMLICEKNTDTALNNIASAFFKKQQLHRDEVVLQIPYTAITSPSRVSTRRNNLFGRVRRITCLSTPVGLAIHNGVANGKEDIGRKTGTGGFSAFRRTRD